MVMVWCRMPGWACCVNSPTRLGYRRRSPPVWRTPIEVRGCMRQERCSRIWRPRSPTARTALMGSASCAAIVSMPSVRQPRPRRCGGWSIDVSTPHICHECARPGQQPDRRRGRPGPPRPPGDGCTSISTPPWSSTTPTTRPRRHRPGRKPSVITRCWRFWTAPRSPVVSRWPGCCARVMRAPTPPLTTSPCSSRRWHPAREVAP